MSAAEASTSQQTETGGEKQYDVCLQYIVDGTYLFGVIKKDACVYAKSCVVFGPAFKKSGETSEIDYPLRMVENCENRPPSKACIKICNIGTDELHKFVPAIVTFNSEVEPFRTHEDQSPGNFMRHAWRQARLNGALNKAQYDAGCEVFRLCNLKVDDQSWPDEEIGRVRELVMRKGGVWYEIDQNGRSEPRMFLNGHQLELDRYTGKLHDVTRRTRRIRHAGRRG
ncbi:uncharacterized protein G6M90_00g065550 [Metarhizium brunneum]|uniref:Uncharacterized protein n=1 Tax=Metarhizium brunneum TaxID=500148 RepID=A0A7D5YRG1_9HYPO